MKLNVQDLNHEVLEDVWQSIITPPVRPLSKKQRQRNPQGVVIALIKGDTPWDVAGLVSREVHERGKAKTFGTVYVTRNHMAFIDMCSKFIANGGGRGDEAYRFMIFQPNGLLQDAASFEGIRWRDMGDLCTWVGHI